MYLFFAYMNIIANVCQLSSALPADQLLKYSESVFCTQQSDIFVRYVFATSFLDYRQPYFFHNSIIMFLVHNLMPEYIPYFVPEFLMHHNVLKYIWPGSF